jgi:hypothetical protein
VKFEGSIEVIVVLDFSFQLCVNASSRQYNKTAGRDRVTDSQAVGTLFFFHP